MSGVCLFRLYGLFSDDSFDNHLICMAEGGISGRCDCIIKAMPNHAKEETTIHIQADVHIYSACVMHNTQCTWAESSPISSAGIWKM